MLSFARPALLIYALVLFGGGIGGYVKAHSLISLLTSSLSALVLVGAFVLSRQRPRQGFALGLAVAVALAAFFGYRFAETHKMMPPGGICALSIAAAVCFGLALGQAANSAAEKITK